MIFRSYFLATGYNQIQVVIVINQKDLGTLKFKWQTALGSLPLSNHDFWIQKLVFPNRDPWPNENCPKLFAVPTTFFDLFLFFKFRLVEISRLGFLVTSKITVYICLKVFLQIMTNKLISFLDKIWSLRGIHLWIFIPYSEIFLSQFSMLQIFLII